MCNFSDQTVIVTGASGNLGVAVANNFHFLASDASRAIREASIPVYGRS